MPHPDFSGSWRFDAAASALQIATPDVALFSVRHQEPMFRLERTLAFGERSDTFAIELIIGGENAPLTRNEATLYPEVHWQGDGLVFRTRIVKGDGEAVNLVHYRLEADGTRLVAYETFRGMGQAYDNRWVFTREFAAP